MKNRDVAEMLERAATILAMRGENRYRVRAYKKAARAVAGADVHVESLARDNRLQSLQGVGPGIAVKIQEIIKTGRLSLLERMETGTLPVVDEDRVILLASALTLSTELLPDLSALPGVTDCALTGEMRRSRETVPGLAVVLAAADLPLARQSLQDYRQLHRQQWDGNFCQAFHSFGIPVSLYLVAAADFALTYWVSTGSPEHVAQVAALIREKTGHDLLYQQADREMAEFSHEEDIYRLADLPLISPQLREGTGEVEAAQDGSLPVLVAAKDYKGDLHTHSDWSDGTAGVEAMVRAAVELGYEYIAVTDHSRSLKIARGLTLERLAEQRNYIAELQRKYPSIRIFSGIEADILDDGSVDAPDDVLAGLDVVVASVHSGFRQSREKLTGRICRAMQNPYVQIIGHATGRLLGKRDPYDVDVDELIRSAAATGTILEINSSPDRLDINGEYARKAREAGVRIAVNTDAHSQLELANVQLGLATARRGWLSRDDVVNTRSATEIIDVLQDKKKNRH